MKKLIPLLLALLLALAACSPSATPDETTSSTEAAGSSPFETSAEETSAPVTTAVPEPTFEVVSYGGAMAVSPDKGDCTLVSGDGACCEFLCPLSLYDLSQRLISEYGLETSDCDWSRFCVFAASETGADGRRVVKAKFMLQLLEPGRYLLHNLTASLLLDDGSVATILFPYYYSVIRPGTQLSTGVWYKVDTYGSIAALVCFGALEPAFLPNGRDYTLYLNGRDVLFESVSTAEGYAMRISDNYKPYEVVYGGSFADTVAKALDEVGGDAAELSIDSERLRFVLKADNGGGYNDDLRVVEFSLDKLGLTEDEAIAALAALSLPKLDVLTIEGYGFGSLEPISHFTSLSKLTIVSAGERSPLADISALSRFSGLASVSITNCSVADIGALAASKASLSQVDFSNNFVADVSPLAGFGLSAAYFAGNKITDAAPLTALVGENGLVFLTLDDNPLESIGTLTLPKPEADGHYSCDMRISFSGTKFASSSFTCYFPD